MVNLRDQELFELYAFRYYQTDRYIMLAEFKVDLKRFKSVVNLINNWGKSKLVSERLILNHIITLHNLFGDFAGVGLMAKTEPEKWSDMKTFLDYLGLFPYQISEYQGIQNNPEIQARLDLLERPKGQPL